MTTILSIFSRPHFLDLFNYQLNKFKFPILIYTEYPDLFNFKTYWNPNLKTIGSIRNYLIDLAKTDFVVFFDDDDIQLKHRIEYQLDFLKKNNLEYMYAKYPVCYDLITNQMFKCLDGPSASTMMIKKSCPIRFSDVNNHEERPFKYSQEDTIIYTILLNHGDNLSNRKSSGNCQDRKFFERYLDQEEIKILYYFNNV